jgi:hypothetical protein
MRRTRVAGITGARMVVFGIAALVGGGAAASIGGAIGCHVVLSLSDYEIVAGGPDGSCFSGDATTNEQLVNACSSTGCTPFDNTARIAGFDGGNPPLPDATPSPDADATPSPDADAGPGDDADALADTAPDAADAPSDTPSGNPKCADLSPRPIYMHGSSSLYLAFATYAHAIASEATLVYKRDGSCNGLASILTGDVMSQGTAEYWVTGSDVSHACDLPPDPGQSVDIGLCDVFATTCRPDLPGLPDNVGDFIGPVQTFMFTVPQASSQKAISAEAAFRVYGLGAASGVSPWDDEAFIFRRNEDSGNQRTISTFIGLPVDRWLGQEVVSSGDMEPRLVESSNPEKTIGITSGDVADQISARRDLRTLAYQHYGQTCAYTPDGDLASFDKKNVRDGHYYMWAPTHFYARVEGGAITDPVVRDVVNYLTGTKPLPSKNTDLMSTLKSSGLVPKCAMRVSRVKEGGELSPFTPHPSCACAFEAATPSGGSSACPTCSSDVECPSDRSSCSFGYCEPG